MQETLKNRVIRHEGLRLKPYRCTAGKLTIGVGRNLDDNGISETEALYLLENDLERCRQSCLQAFPWYGELDEARQGVLVEMCFNLGLTRLKGFSKMLKALELKNYALAAQEMRSSHWAQQVGKRADTLAGMMERGV